MGFVTGTPRWLFDELSKQCALYAFVVVVYFWVRSDQLNSFAQVHSASGKKLDGTRSSDGGGVQDRRRTDHHQTDEKLPSDRRVIDANTLGRLKSKAVVVTAEDRRVMAERLMADRERLENESAARKQRLRDYDATMRAKGKKLEQVSIWRPAMKVDVSNPNARREFTRFFYKSFISQQLQNTVLFGGIAKSKNLPNENFQNITAFNIYDVIVKGASRICFLWATFKEDFICTIQFIHRLTVIRNIFYHLHNTPIINKTR